MAGGGALLRPLRPEERTGTREVWRCLPCQGFDYQNTEHFYFPFQGQRNGPMLRSKTHQNQEARAEGEGGTLI